MAMSYTQLFLIPMYIFFLQLPQILITIEYEHDYWYGPFYIPFIISSPYISSLPNNLNYRTAFHSIKKYSWFIQYIIETVQV